MTVIGIAVDSLGPLYLAGMGIATLLRDEMLRFSVVVVLAQHNTPFHGSMGKRY
ncbi:MAG: hypothetical protein M0Q23_08660 [Syntrophales bacterium]|nr:hypothetical protein [Syntrophales bacterium]MCK9528691.1 hypothetical protein [Syntrophales bacterium]MDX9922644.1 hypothetical protein [Syntrophales bacterium]